MSTSIFEKINNYRKTYPVDVEGLIKSLDIELHEAWLDKGISGQLEKKNGKYRITVNAENSRVRKRFTMAHELGHYVLHRDLVGDGVDDDKAYRSTHEGLYYNTNIGPKQETEANQFAANLLMPHDLLEELRRQGKQPIEIAKIMEVSQPAIKIRMGL